jgi:hypothetical protein
MKTRGKQAAAAGGLAVVGTLAGLMTWGGVAFAQTQSQLTSAYVATGLPRLDPASPAWANAPEIEVPLTAQAAVLPILGTPSVPSMRVKSLHDGQWITFRLEWSDDTKDMQATAQDDFRDAAAIQLPLDHSLPGVCMGVRGQTVNLWHWKADWQNDIDNGFQDITAAFPNFWKDYYPFAVGDPPFRAPTDFTDPDARRFIVGWQAGNAFSDPVRVTPVEEMIAEGFGTGTHREEQGVLGRGVWADGKWAVVFERPLVTSSEMQSQLRPGGTAMMAVAAWNGANGEVGSRKQISSDFRLSIAAPAGASAVTIPPAPRQNMYWVPVTVAVVFGALTIAAALAGHLAGAFRRQRADTAR